MARKSKEEVVEVLGLIGIGLDQKDGHRRVTKGEEFILVGGSQETHEHMQDVAIRVTESLKDKGKRLQDACADELIDLVREALERQ